MKTTPYISLFFILLFFGANAQNTNSSLGNSISYNFNKVQISAYQNSSVEKFAQFAEYFNILQKTQDKELNVQLKQSVFSLFESPETEISDFLSGNEKTTLRHFLDKYENSGRIFQVVSRESDDSVLRNSWVNMYQIKTDSGKKIILQQTISFQIQEKKFGKTVKEIWEIKLGNLTVEQ